MACCSAARPSLRRANAAQPSRAAIPVNETLTNIARSYDVSHHVHFVERRARGRRRLDLMAATSARYCDPPRSGIPRGRKPVMATTTVVSGGVAPPLTLSDRWTRYSVTVLAMCILGWAFDIYEATIMQLVTPILIKTWGITPATMGFVTTLSRWIGLIGTFVFPISTAGVRR
jgi:hypothetical protein